MDRVVISLVVCLLTYTAEAGIFFTSHNERIRAITEFRLPADEFKAIVLFSPAAQQLPVVNMQEAVAQEITMLQLVAHKKLGELCNKEEIQFIYDTQKKFLYSKFHWTTIKFMVRQAKYLASHSGQVPPVDKNNKYSPTENRLFALFIPQNRVQQNIARSAFLKQSYFDKMRESFNPQEMEEVLRMAEEPLMQKCKSIFDNLRVEEYRSSLPANGVPPSALGWGSGWGWHWGWRR